MQSRGAIGMGVDQYTSTHTFESRADGGRITLVRDREDSAGVDAIRAHLRSIAAAFAAGDFATPAFVHADSVPGTAVMTARRARIHYDVAPIERGGEMLITTSDSAALEAIHRFLAYQRREHRTDPTSESLAPAEPGVPARGDAARAPPGRPSTFPAVVAATASAGSSA